MAAARGLALTLAHVDHQADPGSRRRAERARELAASLGLELRLMTVDVPRRRRRRESPEAAARRLRYAALEGLRKELGASRILTAHHRDDLVETVLLKLLRGAAIERLGGIAERRGALLRPLLGVSRGAIEARLARDGVDPVRDATNEDLALPRNRVRHRLLPALRTDEPSLDEALLALAARAEALRARLDQLFSLLLKDKTKTSIERKDGGRRIVSREADPRTEASALLSEGRPRAEAQGARSYLAAEVTRLPVAFLSNLPTPLQPPALRWLLTERLDVGQLPSFPSMNSFLSLSSRGRAASLRLPGDRRTLVARRGALELAAPESRTAPFTYTFSLPGEVELPELGLRLRVRRSPVEPWMLRGERMRAGFRADASSATVRSRRSGDRLRPLGAPGSRKLKAVLIDRGVPAAARDRLPLLEIAGELVWVPGVTIGERFALAGDAECWLAELERLAPTAPADERGERETR